MKVKKPFSIWRGCYVGVGEDMKGEGVMDDKRWLTGYKVVKKDRTRYISCFMKKEFGRGYKVYAIGHKTIRSPGYGPLAVFRSENDARRFMKRHDMYAYSFALFKCRYTVSLDHNYWRRVGKGRGFCTFIVIGKQCADVVELTEELVVL